MAKKEETDWVQNIIREFTPKFKAIASLGDGLDDLPPAVINAAKEEAKRSLSEEAIGIIRDRKGSWRSKPQYLGEMRKGLEPMGFSGSFSAEEWDDMKPPAEADKRRKYRKEKAIEEALSHVLGEDELASLKDASEKSGVTIAEIAKRGIMAEAKARVTKASKSEDLSVLSNNALAKSKSIGASQELAQRAIEAIIAHNDKQENKASRWYVSQGFVARFLQEKLRVRTHQATAKKAIEMQLERVKKHNAEHELKATDNRKGVNSQHTIEQIEFPDISQD